MMPKENMSERGVERVPFGLFRREIRNGAHHGVATAPALSCAGHGLRGSELGRSLDELGESEVEDLGVAGGGDHDVCGLEIAMHDAGGVRGGDGVGYVRCVLQCVRETQPAMSNQIFEGLALDVLHGDVGEAVAFAHVVDVNDAGMIEGGGGPGFVHQTRQLAGVHGLRSEHLMATRRSRWVSRAFQTTPMPPSPSCSTIS